MSLRVFHLIKGLGRGGAEMLLLETQRATPPSRVTYGYGYLLPWKDALAEPLRMAGGEVVCFPHPTAASLPRAVWQVARHLEAFRADLLHCHLPVTGVVGRLAGRLAGVPVVYTEHNLHERYHPLTRRLNLWTWGLQERVVAVSGEVRDSALRHAGERVLVEVILNGVPVDRFRPDSEARARLRRELGIAPQAPVVGTVAVFRPQKRLHDWLEAARRIREAHGEARFLLVGDGPLRGELEERARQLGLGDAVLFPGLQEEVRPYLGAMDLFLQSSDFEGLPVALLEALAMELPVVATAVGGVPEVVEPGVSGILVPPGQPEDLAEAVVDLLARPERARALGAAGHARVVERFSMERMLLSLEALYRRVLERSGRKDP
jgi:glycosyltransferase involved in cell wall biosynthesis